MTAENDADIIHMLRGGPAEAPTEGVPAVIGPRNASEALGILPSTASRVDSAPAEETAQALVPDPDLAAPQDDMEPARLMDGDGDDAEMSRRVKNLLSLFSGSVEQIVHNQAEDRREVSSMATLLGDYVRQRLQGGEVRGMGPFLDALARLLQTKADINSNSSRALDSIAKLLSASKSNDVILSLNSSGPSLDGLDLEALLRQPPAEDET